MKTLLLLCLVAASTASAAEPSHEQAGPRASRPQELDYRPVYREALMKGQDPSRWVEAVRTAFKPLRDKSGPHGVHPTPRGH